MRSMQHSTHQIFSTQLFSPLPGHDLFNFSPGKQTLCCLCVLLLLATKLFLFTPSRRFKPSVTADPDQRKENRCNSSSAVE